MLSKLRNEEYRATLGSLGLSAYRTGCLDRLNAALSSYGSETKRDFSRVTIKEKPGQQTDVGKSNVKVASFSGKL